jgi:hypothetical protein
MRPTGDYSGRSGPARVVRAGAADELRPYDTGPYAEAVARPQLVRAPLRQGGNAADGRLRPGTEHHEGSSPARRPLPRAEARVGRRTACRVSGLAHPVAVVPQVVGVGTRDVDRTGRVHRSISRASGAAQRSSPAQRSPVRRTCLLLLDARSGSGTNCGRTTSGRTPKPSRGRSSWRRGAACRRAAPLVRRAAGGVGRDGRTPRPRSDSRRWIHDRSRH